MAERIVSPGVFTREFDLSFLAQGISEIGGAFIGPTPKGPAFIPTIVRSQQEYVTRFGEADANHYTGLTVKNYLREAGVATIVRVLGLQGYDPNTVQSAVLYAQHSESSTIKVFAVLHPTSTGNSILSASANGSPVNFTLSLSSSISSGSESSSFSTLKSDDTYLVDYLGTNPQGTKSAYVYSVFPNAPTELAKQVILANVPTYGTVASASDATYVAAFVSSSLKMFAIASNTALSLSGSTDGVFKNAHTPWIQSQTVGGSKTDLFRLHTFSDGNSANKEIKASILNMRPSDDPDYAYGTFSLIIRRYNDSDTRMEILEQYDNLNFDPDSPQYIARAIGNSAPYDDPVSLERYYQGDFQNKSQYVYVEMTDGYIPPTALPYGFAQVESTVTWASTELVNPTYIESRFKTGNTFGYTTGSVDKKYFYGWSFLDTDGTNESYLGPIPKDATNVGSAFNLEDLVDVPKVTAPFSQSINLNDITHLAYRKFSVPFQGGFDGFNPARDINMGGNITPTNSQGFNLSTSLSQGSLSYKKALDAIANPDQFDFNLLVMPGVIYDYHPYIADYALTICEDRGDAFYIMDTVGLDSTVANETSVATSLDTNYAATYYPWLRVQVRTGTIDTNTNRLLWVPPSVILPEVYAYNDNVSAEWFAPAGLNRGGIASAIGVKVRLPQSSRDTLYESRVNPIAQFPGQGICVWGQKTLQRRPSALDRVNVRRLLIAVKKFIASSARYLVFEQNVEATRNRFLNIVNPYLSSVQERSGLYAFRVVMDESNNTPDLIDRNILYGQLYLQPTKTAEFIILDFNVLPTGATFGAA